MGKSPLVEFLGVYDQQIGINSFRTFKSQAVVLEECAIPEEISEIPTTFFTCGCRSLPLESI
jgi:hypothetical protein